MRVVSAARAASVCKKLLTALTNKQSYDSTTCFAPYKDLPKCRVWHMWGALGNAFAELRRRKGCGNRTIDNRTEIVFLL